MASASPLKRLHESMDFPDMPVVAMDPAQSLASPKASAHPEHGDQADPSSPTSPLTEIAGSIPSLSRETTPNVKQTQLFPAKADPVAQDGPPPKKRKKLTHAEKQQKEEERTRKEAEKQEKEEEKKRKQAQAEEARRIKAEKEEEKKKAKEVEKAKKDEVKKQKDAEKQQKDTDRRAKEEEKAKKERAQQRINAFFTKSKPALESAGSSRRNSIASADGVTPFACSRTGSEAPPSIITDYEKAFPPFFLHPHTILARISQHEVNRESAEAALQEIWGQSRATAVTEEDLAGLREKHLGHISASAGRVNRYTAPPSVKNLVSQLQGSASHPVDLTVTMGKRKRSPLQALQSLPIKYLKFQEDVRPAWKGTFTKTPERGGLRKLSLNPFLRSMPLVNYDYDSEAEWEEPEEGEELGSEDEEEGEDDEGDMEGFLDDEEDGNAPKRKQILGDMEPVYTSMHWESSSPHTQSLTVPYGQTTIDLASFRIETLLPNQPFPIDPFSTAYWTPSVSSPDNISSLHSDTLNMGPPMRAPLNTIKGPNHQLPAKLAAEGATKKAAKVSVAKPLSSDLLEDFKEAVDGSDLTKVGLIEVLKKKFPSATRHTVEQTLLQVAERVGSKPAEKKWKLRDS